MDAEARSWAAETFSMMSTSVLQGEIEKAAEVYQRKRPPKGKPVSREFQVDHMKSTAGARVCLSGPRHMGVTSTLSRLATHGYKIIH